MPKASSIPSSFRPPTSPAKVTLSATTHSHVAEKLSGLKQGPAGAAASERSSAEHWTSDPQAKAKLNRELKFITNLRLSLGKAASEEKSHVYLHYSAGKGGEDVHFSPNRGLKDRLGLAGGDFARAKKVMEDHWFKLSSSTSRQTVADLRAELNAREARIRAMARELHAKVPCKTGGAETVTASQKPKAPDSIPSGTAKLEPPIASAGVSRTQKSDIVGDGLSAADKRLATRSLYGCTKGAEHINSLCRKQAERTFGVDLQRKGVEAPRPDVDEVGEFYRTSDGESEFNSFPEKAHRVTKQLLEGGRSLIGALLETLDEKYPLGTYFRGVRLTFDELQKYQIAFKQEKAVRMAAFTSVTPEKKCAEKFKQGQFGNKEGMPMMIKIIGSPYKFKSAYEIEGLFKPGQCFKVIAMNPGKITLSTVETPAKREGYIVA